LQIPVQTPTHNAPIISTFGEADKLDNISSLEDGLNRVNKLFCDSLYSLPRIQFEHFIKFRQAAIMRATKQSALAM